MTLRVKELKKTGPKPEKPKDQVAWLTDLMGKLQRLLELGDQSDDLARVAFSGDVFSATFNLFPDKEMLKLSMTTERHGRYTRERMENFLTQIDKKRGDANHLDKIKITKDKGGGAGIGGGSGVKSYPITQQTNPKSAPNLDCRICKKMEQGSHTDLFLNHQGKSTHDCPKFVALTPKERQKICADAKICFSCLSHEVTFSPTHLANCEIRKKAKSGNKTELTCQAAYCSLNIWVCTKHKDDPVNASIIQKRKNQMTQRGWTLGMVAILPTIVTKPASIPTTAQWDSFNSVHTDSEDSRFEELDSSPAQHWQHTPTTAQLDSFNSIQTQSENSRIEEFISNAEKDGTRVIAEPQGKPIFKFFAAWGRVHPVITFFDDGCSDCVMREGVPGIEWDGIITKKGPFNMGGVGGLATATRDEWMVLAPLANGEKQVLALV